MLELSPVALPLAVGEKPSQAEHLMVQAAARALGISSDKIRAVQLVRRSVDARKKHDVHFVATLAVDLGSASLESELLQAAEARKGFASQKGVRLTAHKPFAPLTYPHLSSVLRSEVFVRPVVVGTGPAGLFAALTLAHAGLKPLVFERGADVDTRVQVIELFNEGAPLNFQTNIQFGEGGAGTFSDGKLTTGTKSEWTRQILQWFVEAGAPKEILWQAKPHIGTDLLVDVVRNLRRAICELGGDVRFCAQVTNFVFRNNSLCGVEVTTGEGVEFIPANQVVLACGHSARDTFATLYDAGVLFEQKPFSVGVRIEHPQELIDQVQYGTAHTSCALGAADYKLSVHLPNGRGVYTFCMCPGGEVVCAASEEKSVTVNGMSRFARNQPNANSALLVGVSPEDFESSHPLAGIAFQQKIERAAYDLAISQGGKPYQAPAQTVGDFLSHTAGTPSAKIVPSYARGVVWCDLHECLPQFVTQSMEEALPLLNRKLAGFGLPDAVMTGVETRSSSPVRIVRNVFGEAYLVGKNHHPSIDDSALSCEYRKATGSKGSGVAFCPERDALSSAFNKHYDTQSGLYPCGEGAGYAGGIMSAACDGVRIAFLLMEGLIRHHSNREDQD